MLTELCSAWCMGKARRTYAPPLLTVHKTPFELVHTDLWGPSPIISSCGYTYYITFVDWHTKFTWIYFLKQKSDSIRAYTQFLSLIETQFSTKVKSIQSDWGGEYRPLTKILNDQGNKHRLTCPHTSHQNGTVERKHRQVVQMGLTLLAHAWSLTLTYWDHSFTTSVYLINRIPSSALPNYVSPYEALYHMAPDYMLLRAFGCACFPHIRPYNRHKMEFRSKQCVYLGVSPSHKGHKYLEPN